MRRPFYPFYPVFPGRKKFGYLLLLFQEASPQNSLSLKNYKVKVSLQKLFKRIFRPRYSSKTSSQKNLERAKYKKTPKNFWTEKVPKIKKSSKKSLPKFLEKIKLKLFIWSSVNIMSRLNLQRRYSVNIRSRENWEQESSI